MSVRRLAVLMRGLGYVRAEAASSVPAPEPPKRSTSGDLARLVAMKPKDMGIVYVPKKASD